jgi:hypothetical protein
MLDWFGASPERNGVRRGESLLKNNIMPIGPGLLQRYKSQDCEESEGI